MALAAAMKDRARLIRKEADAKRVEGRTHFNPVYGPLFRCRLTLEEVPESRDAGGVTSTVVKPSLMTLVRDKEHNQLQFNPDDVIEVESRDLGEGKGWHVVARYEVEGEAKPIRKKRRVIGWELKLSKMSEAPFDRGRVAP